MNIDIRIKLSFPHNPKTLKLKRRLGADGVLSLITLWCWAAEERPNGSLTGLDAEDIELAAGWEGEEGKLFQTLIDLRWIETVDGTYCLHAWEEHQAWASKSEERSACARNAAQTRWQGQCKQSAMPKNADRMQTAMPEDAERMRNDADRMQTAMPQEPRTKSQEPRAKSQRKEGEPPLPPRRQAASNAHPAQRFVPPTVEEVAAYCASRNNGINAQHFVDYHEARGWVLKNGQKVKNWQACVRTWEGREMDQARASPHSGQAMQPRTVAEKQYLEREERAKALLAVNMQRQQHEIALEGTDGGADLPPGYSLPPHWHQHG